MKSNFNDAANHFQSGQINKAKEICLEILKTEPDNFNVLHLLGVIAFQTKNYLKSVEIITKAIEINPNNAEVYNFRGIVLVHLNKLEEAIQNWNKAITINPNGTLNLGTNGKIQATNIDLIKHPQVTKI